MTARARRHALSRNDENVNEAVGVMGRVRKCAYRSTSCANKIREGGRRETEEGDNSREGNRVDRFVKVFPYTGSVAYEFFRVPLKSAA